MSPEQHVVPKTYDYERLSFDNTILDTSSLASTLSYIMPSPYSPGTHVEGDGHHQESLSQNRSSLHEPFSGTIKKSVIDDSQQHEVHRTVLQRVIHFGWWWETGSAILAVVCTALIVAILFAMDGKSVNDWKIMIQPNSLVAVFSTIAKSSLLFPLAECMGQLKWAYFERPRKVSEMQIFDMASRGPWGSLQLLWTTKGRAMLASLGAVVTILMLAFEPFAQQVIVFSTRNHQYHNMTGSLSVSRKWVDKPPAFISEDTKAAGRNAYIPLMTGILTALADQPYIPAPNFDCPTSECRISNVAALGICSTCESESIDINGFDDCKYTVMGNNGTDPVSNGTYQEFKTYLREQFQPNGSAWAYSKCQKGYKGYPTITIGYDGIITTSLPSATLRQDGGVYGLQQEASWNNDFTFEQNTDGIPGTKLRFCTYNQTSTKEDVLPGENKPTNIAQTTCFSSETDLSLYNDTARVGEINGTVTRCQLYLCARNYEEIVITNGKKSFKGTTASRLSTDDKRDLIFEDDLNINWTATNSPNQQFRTGFTSRLDLVDQFLAIANPLEEQEFNYELEANKFSSSTAFDNFTALFDRIASAMTDVIQSSTNPNISSVPLDVYGQEIYVDVRWRWMLMPLSVVFISLVFMLLTIFESSKKEYLFKTSILAIMFHGLDTLERDEGTEVGHEEGFGHGNGRKSADEDLWHRTKSIKAVLKKDENERLKLKKE